MTQGEKLCIMRELYENGSSIESIAEILGYKKSSVNQLLAKAGIKRERKLSDCRAEIIKMRNDGKTLEEIANNTGFSPVGICRFLRKQGFGKNSVPDNKEEADLLNENTLFAKKREEKVERIFDGGKWYVTVPLDKIYQN